MESVREWYDELPSTQDRALALARNGAAAGSRVLARRQSRGRGRLDHIWESPPGGLYLSIVLPAPEGPSTLFPLALGARVAERFNRRWGLSLRLKWPNDILSVSPEGRGRKLAGILVDRVPSPTYGVALVAGVGVNVAVGPEQFPRDLGERVITLSELGDRPPSLEEVEAMVVSEALGTVEGFRSPQGIHELRTLCRRLLWGIGRRATLDGRPVGTITTLGDEGELWVEEKGEPLAIRAGDLRVEESS